MDSLAQVALLGPFSIARRASLPDSKQSATNSSSNEPIRLARFSIHYQSKRAIQYTADPFKSQNIFFVLRSSNAKSSQADLK